jgi:hypothetical protein
MTNSKFNTARANGFHMTFVNGLTVSVQWGFGTYSDNYDNSDALYRLGMASTTAEIAVLGKDGEFIDPAIFGIENGDGDVAGSLSANEVADFIHAVAHWGE